ncbi:putative ribonuclease H-like domain-containing protein [Tanacetum coccineum]
MTALSIVVTNDANMLVKVSTSSPNVNAASPQVSTASVSDNSFYAFMDENPNGSNVLHQDLEQIHEDDLGSMNMSPRAVLLKAGLTPVNTVWPVYTAYPKSAIYSAKSKSHFSKQAQSTAQRPFYKKTDLLGGYVAAFGRGDMVLRDENQILFKIPRKDNMYSFDMKNIVPKESLTFLVTKATLGESMLWHRRLGHINFKNINKLVKDNLVRGLPTKHFENDQTCVACRKRKQHRASLVTDDYSRFTWAFFLTTKDETSEILKNCIKEIENLVDKKVKIIRSDNGTEFKNKVMGDFCREKDSLGKFDGKSDEGLFVRYSFGSKLVRYTTLGEGGLEENLHIGFLENKSMIEGNGPKWLFDIDSLTQSMNYVPLLQVQFLMTLEVQLKDSPNNENDEQDKFEDDSNTKDVNAVGQHVNIASPDVNTGSLKLNVVGPSVNTASSNEQDSPKDMFTMEVSHTLEATHIEFFSDEDEPEVDL